MKTIETNWSHDQKALVNIRSKVFIEEQHVPAELEIDAQDADAIHFLVMHDNSHFIATARLLRNGHIGRIAVLKEYRNQGVGTQLLSDILAKAKQLELDHVFLHAQIDAEKFYEKHGFLSHGNIFMDAGIPHIKMIRKLNNE